MIRFAIKCALGLGLLALVLPLGKGSDSKESNLNVFGLAVGFQEALSDIGGFCGRAPAACDAAHDVAVFAGERIGDGFRIGYQYIEAQLTDRRDAAPSKPAEPSAPKPSAAAFVETQADPSGPQPYQPPKRAHAEPGHAELSADGAEPAPAKVPTPHPRG